MIYCIIEAKFYPTCINDQVDVFDRLKASLTM